MAAATTVALWVTERVDTDLRQMAIQLSAGARRLGEIRSWSSCSDLCFSAARIDEFADQVVG